MVVRIDPRSSADLRALAKQLRTVGAPASVRRDTVKALRAAATPTRDAIRAAALGLPDGPPTATTGLRKRMAAATRVQVRLGGRDPAVDVRITRKAMGEQANLVRATNRGPWRHPVYGNRNRWVAQKSRSGWFDTAANRNAARTRQEMSAVLDRLARKLAHR